MLLVQGKKLLIYLVQFHKCYFLFSSGSRSLTELDIIAPDRSSFSREDLSLLDPRGEIFVEKETCIGLELKLELKIFSDLELAVYDISSHLDILLVDAKTLIAKKIGKSGLQKLFYFFFDVFLCLERDGLLSPESDMKHILHMICHPEWFAMPARLDDPRHLFQCTEKLPLTSDFFQCAFVDSDPLPGDGILVFESRDPQCQPRNSKFLAQMFHDIHRVQISFFKIHIKGIPLLLQGKGQYFFYDKILGFLFKGVEHLQKLHIM
jgi:hypothetical protein